MVTQHLVELLRNGVPLPGRHMGSSELGVRALQPQPSCPQHRHNLPWEVPTGPRGHGQMDNQAGVGRRRMPGLTTRSTKSWEPEPAKACKTQPRCLIPPK